MKKTLVSVCSLAVSVWQTCNGEAAYERYLQHWQQHHAESQRQPLNRKAFFAAETQRKWNGIKRCC